MNCECVPLVLLKDNLHICSSKSHQINSSYLVHLWHQLFSMEQKCGNRVLTKEITGKIRAMFSLNDCPHDKELSIGAPGYNLGRDGSSPYHRGILPISHMYPTALGAPWRKELESHCISINALSLYQCSLDSPYLTWRKWRYSSLVCWNATMVRVTWHKHKCTIPIPMQLGLSLSNMKKVGKE